MADTIAGRRVEGTTIDGAVCDECLEVRPHEGVTVVCAVVFVVLVSCSDVTCCGVEARGAFVANGSERTLASYHRVAEILGKGGPFFFAGETRIVGSTLALGRRRCASPEY